MAIVDTSEIPVHVAIANEAYALRHLGLSNAAIARHLGVSDKTVAKAILRRGAD